MPRFFLDQIGEDTALLSGEDARHITKSLRMRPGDELVLCDQKSFDYRCEIAALHADTVEVAVLGKSPCISEPKAEVVLYQALPKGDKLEFIAQKATELGVSEIVPVLTERCVSRPDAKSMEKKRLRLEKIVLEAAKQSGRGKIPRVSGLLTFSQAVERMKQAHNAILLYEGATEPLRTFLAGAGEQFALMVGSEGGFSPEEAALARQQGVSLASLGTRILRCETAPICALSALFYSLGEF